MTSETANTNVRAPYEAPSVRDLGPIAEVTRGTGGGTLDAVIASA